MFALFAPVLKGAAPREDWYDNLNKFAKKYNEFVGELQKDGRFDAKLWLDCCKIFHKLEE